MNALIGLIIGGIVGWFIGYIVVMSRIIDTDSPLAKGIGMMMAPTAPDTILCAGIGAIIGFLIGMFASK